MPDHGKVPRISKHGVVLAVLLPAMENSTAVIPK
jgi:hypothetical protein